VWEKAIYKKNSELVEHGENIGHYQPYFKNRNLDSYIGFCLKLIRVQQARWGFDTPHQTDIG
jgi:hypothetical protein